MLPSFPVLPGGAEPFSSDFALNLPINILSPRKSKKKIRLHRTAHVSFDILTGQDVLMKAAELARLLWNDLHLLWCERSQAVKWFQTWYEVRDTLRPAWRGRLSDQCFSYTVREFDSAVRSWLRVCQTNPKANPPGLPLKPRPLTSAIGQNARVIGPWTFRLALLGKHHNKRHLIVRVKSRPGVKMRQVKLVQIRTDGPGVLTYRVDAASEIPGQNIAGIDLGVYNLAAIAFQSGESTLYNGRALLDLSRYYAKRITLCNSFLKQEGPSNNEPSPRSQAFRAKIGHIRYLAVHNLTSSIITECLEREVGTIVLGRLKYIRSKTTFDRNTRQMLRTWPFDQITRQITYKAKAVNIKVILVNEAYTSQTCHRCGQRGQRVKRGLFHCPHCLLTINADINGSFNILNKVSPVRAWAGMGKVESLSHSVEKAEFNHWPKLVGPTHVAKFRLNSFTIARHPIINNKLTLNSTQHSDFSISKAYDPKSCMNLV